MFTGRSLDGMPPGSKKNCMRNQDTVCLLQARSSSTRLPGKVFHPLPEHGPSILEHCIRRLEKSGVGPVYALIPHDDQIMQEFLERRSISFIAGPLEDVRERYSMAARLTKARWIVRATADNPCVDPRFVHRSVEEIQKSGADLFAFTGLPLGCAVEVFTAEALDARYGTEDLEPSAYREHVSLHIKHHPRHYNVQRMESGLPSEITGNMRLTVDEPADLRLVDAVFHRLGCEFSVEELLDLYRKDPELFSLNAQVQQRKFPAHLFAHRHSA